MRHGVERVRIRAVTQTEYVLASCSTRKDCRQYQEQGRYSTLDAAVDAAENRFGPLCSWIGLGASVTAYTQEYVNGRIG